MFRFVSLRQDQVRYVKSGSGALRSDEARFGEAGKLGYGWIW